MARGRPRKTDPDDALERIAKVFWEHGYDGASLSALSAAAHMAKPGLYANFGDKEEMFAKALTYYFQDKGRAVLDDLMNSPDPMAVALRRYLEAIADMVEDPECPNGCFVVNSLVDSGSLTPDLVALSRDFDLRRRQAVQRRLRLAEERGELPRGSDADALAEFFSSQVLALAVMARSGVGRETLQQVVDVAMSVLPAESEPSAGL